MTKSVLTKKEEQGVQIREKIMFEITNYFLAHGYAPTIQEIAAATGLSSTSSVSYHIGVLLKEGRLETDAKIGSPRALRVKGMRVVFVNAENEKKGAKKHGIKN